MKIEALQVIDSDSHLTELEELLTTRRPRRYLDRAPAVQFDESGTPIGGNWMADGCPRWDCPAMLVRRSSRLRFRPRSNRAICRVMTPMPASSGLEFHGIEVQLICSNIVAFEAHGITTPNDGQLEIELVRASHDYVCMTTRRSSIEVYDASRGDLYDC